MRAFFRQSPPAGAAPADPRDLGHCPITQQSLDEVAPKHRYRASDGQLYDRAALRDYLLYAGPTARSPLTRGAMAEDYRALCGGWPLQRQRAEHALRAAGPAALGAVTRPSVVVGVTVGILAAGIGGQHAAAVGCFGAAVAEGCSRALASPRAVHVQALWGALRLSAGVTTPFGELDARQRLALRQVVAAAGVPR